MVKENIRSIENPWNITSLEAVQTSAISEAKLYIDDVIGSFLRKYHCWSNRTTTKKNQMNVEYFTRNGHETILCI